jgi:hypothetical protein
MIPPRTRGRVGVAPADVIQDAPPSSCRGSGFVLAASALEKPAGWPAILSAVLSCRHNGHAVFPLFDDAEQVAREHDETGSLLG